MVEFYVRSLSGVSKIICDGKGNIVEITNSYFVK